MILLLWFLLWHHPSWGRCIAIGNSVGCNRHEMIAAVVFPFYLAEIFTEAIAACVAFSVLTR